MSLASAISSFGSIALGLLGELVAPSLCAACDAEVRPRLLFCPSCRTTIERAPAVEHAPTDLASFAYGGALATAITRLKYQNRADLGLALGATMLPVVALLAERVDVVIPIPLHPKRLAERGYNQTSLLATPVARRLAVRLETRALARVRDTTRQASLDREHRLVNIAGAFEVRRPPRIRDARVLLVDDVRTTGATLAACRSVLRAAGARTVITLVLAERA